MAEVEEQELESEDWQVELETAVLEGSCDIGIIRNICKGRQVPEELRPAVWKICLNVAGKGDSMESWDGVFDLPQQEVLRQDCLSLLEKYEDLAEDQLAILSDMESVLTFYAKSRSLQYASGNGWVDVLAPLIPLRLPRQDLYNCFYAIMTKYIPRDCKVDGKPFHLFRLLLLYQDPELCNFLDTKRISADTYALMWIQSLFASPCELSVVQPMWDLYLQQADPFFLFFLALVILVNAKEQILPMENEDKQVIVDTLKVFPAQLEAEDIEDFCALALYYSSRTPQSFRKDYQYMFGGSLTAREDTSEEEMLSQALCLPVSLFLTLLLLLLFQDYQYMFGGSLTAREDTSEEEMLSQALCLPVSVAELLQATEETNGDSVHYFVVDCRPADQYNTGHLSTAFHLDANLMLQVPTEFALAVQALFSAQRTAIAAGSVAGGEHLCFMGSGRDEEDQYVHMVVAHFLQRHTAFISLARGGYHALHTELVKREEKGDSSFSVRTCIVSTAGEDVNGEHDGRPGAQGASLINKLSSAVRHKSDAMKEQLSKIKDKLAEGAGPVERHVSSSDKLGKPYRGVKPVFSIGDEEDDHDEMDSFSVSDDEHEVVNLDTWLKKPDVIQHFPCQEVKESGHLLPSHLLLTSTHMYVLRDNPDRKGMSFIQSRHALTEVVKITSKKRHPDLITFKYGISEEEGVQVTGMERFLIPEAATCTRFIKDQILKVLDATDS
ncbi:PREDICTED: TBC1 domain family member 23-like isoform X2 [Branchiostoma belcheri]|uniref:TBC1 domain family member 23 n=2 Tax=Branchiostoma belcheri TaxID=7741 RepID=A0A6P5A9C9_BRABE|nr:PREDICTED: TBC1 domain family member 23-like isoform X1 [Branchiostoma belcheri]XP_019642824.1 PREDICTED: TBC1 domain family member 23-like isoform X2 [Branchiostoma belcheri]